MVRVSKVENYFTGRINDLAHQRLQLNQLQVQPVDTELVKILVSNHYKEAERI